MPPPANSGPSFATWQKGKFHANVGTVNSVAGKCVNCHYNIMPNARFLGYNHTTLISATGTIPTPMGNLTTDCASCHSSNVGTSWTGARAASPHTAAFLQSSSCVACHVEAGPTTYTPGTPVGMPTGAINIARVGYTLTFYHIPPATIPGQNGGTVAIRPYNLSKTQCLYCHFTAANNIVVPPNGTVIIGKAPAPGTTGWGPGMMGAGALTSLVGNHNLAPTSFTFTQAKGITTSVGGTRIPTCAACHEPHRRAGTITGRIAPAAIALARAGRTRTRLPWLPKGQPSGA